MDEVRKDEFNESPLCAGLVAKRTTGSRACYDSPLTRRLGRTTAVRRAVSGFIDDLLDGVGAATALRGASERRIDTAHARPLRGPRDGGPDLGVTEDVA